MLLSSYDALCFLISFVILVLGVVGAVVALPGRVELSVSRSPIPFLLLGFWALGFVSVLLSKASFTSYIYFCYLSMFPLAFIFAALVPEKDRFFRSISIVSAIIFAALSAVILGIYFFFPELLRFGLSHWPFGNPNSLAGFLSLGFFCVYGFLLQTKDVNHKRWAFVLALLIIAAMLTTGSRGALVALIVGFLFLLGFLLKRFKNDWKWHVSFAGLSLGIFVALSVFAPQLNPQTPGDILAQSVSGDLPILYDRPHIWASTWQIIQENFWFGTGIGTFFLVYPAYRAGDVSTSGHMAHSDPLQFWMEMGVFSPLIFYALIGFAVFKTFQALNALDQDDDRRIMIVAPFCAFGALVLHTHISFHFYVLPILFASGTLLAFWLTQVERVLPSGEWSITKGVALENILVKLCLLMLLLCCAFMLVLSQGSELLVSHAKARIKANDIAGFAWAINAADDMAFHRNARALSVASTVPSTTVRANGAQLSKSETLKMILLAEGLLDQAIGHNPYLGRVYLEKARVVELALKYVPNEYKAQHKGEDVSVRALVEEALRINPLVADTRIKLAELMMAQEQSQQAFDLMKAGMHWPYKPEHEYKYFQVLAALALEVGDTEIQSMALKRVMYIEMRRREAIAKLRKK